MNQEWPRADARCGGDGRSGANSRLVALSVLVVVALAVAVLVLLNVGAKVMRAHGERTAITEEQYRSARIGSVTRGGIERRFGPSVSMPRAVSETCDYYLQHGRHATVFKLCFDASGTLISKSRGTN